MNKKLKNEKTPNVELYSYLNIRNRNLGKWYKESGISPLPENFELNEKVVHDALLIGQMKNKRFTIPFGNENKSYIRKKAKLSEKNCKRIIAYMPNLPYSKEFVEHFTAYLQMRLHLTVKLFENAKKEDFDEIEIFREIHNLDPVFADLLEFGEDEHAGLYAQKLGPVLDGLEEKYYALYSKKLKQIEANNNKKAKQQVEKQTKADLEKSKEAGAKIQREAEEKKKEKNKNSAEKIRQEIKTANAENKIKKSKDKK